MIQKEVWLREEDFSRYAGKSAPISLVGFRIMTMAKIWVGRRSDGTAAPDHLPPEIEGREVLIPITEDF
jgi:16S rRNA processing protein RimM